VISNLGAEGEGLEEIEVFEVFESDLNEEKVFLSENMLDDTEMIKNIFTIRSIKTGSFVYFMFKYPIS
jgi:hypothetical protein